MRGVLDEKITAIADSLTKANAEKEEAQLVLSAIKQELRDFDQILKDKDNEVEARIAILQENHKKQLADLITDRENHHKALLNFERQNTMTALKEELTKTVLFEFKAALLQILIFKKPFKKKALPSYKTI